ncbi:MAG TPA: chlorite dismutase family protein [Chloroflexota bacterium]|nr:chlorite dismutase family protein [Chloroflexota bacterium]
MASEEKPRQQFVRFAFYKVDPAWRALPAGEKAGAREDFEQIVQQFGEAMILRSYSTVGTRGDCDFLLWQVSYDMDDLHRIAARLNASKMGPYLSLAYSYLAMTKRSVYVDKHVHEGQEGRMRAVKPTDAKYFFVYPFVKTRQWYRESLERRQQMMDTHIQVGHKYPSVKLNTTYSFGLDDQEFVVAFESNEPQDFLDLVMELREAESSLFTLRDTPIFTCIQMPLSECLKALG